MGHYRIKKMPLKRAKRNRSRSLRLAFLAVNVRGKSHRARTSRRIFQLAAAYFLQKARADFEASLPAPFHMTPNRGLSSILSCKNGRMLFNTLRYTYNDVKLLSHHFLPETIGLHGHHTTVAGIDAMAVLLARLASTSTLDDLSQITGFGEAELSDIIRTTSQLIVTRWWRCLTHPQWLSEDRLSRYNAAITASFR